nr:hypothetical protein [Tanacetum cinerariifolium]
MIWILILYCLVNVDRMAPKRTSTSEAPAMTQAAIRQLVADSVADALETRAANITNTDNTNRKTRPRETPAVLKHGFVQGTNDHKQKFDDRRNTTYNVNNNYPNNRDNNNYPNDRNNHYHQQQNKRQETVRAYATTPTENKRAVLVRVLLTARKQASRPIVLGSLASRGTQMTLSLGRDTHMTLSLGRGTYMKVSFG